MKIGQLEAENENQPFKITKSISGIVITLVQNDVDAPEIRAGRSGAIGYLVDMVGSSTIQVVLQPKHGKNEFLIERMKLSTVLQKVGSVDGTVSFEFEEVVFHSGVGTMTMRAYIPFSDEGRIPLDEDEEIQVTISNLPAETAVTSMLYGVESADLATDVIRMSFKSLPQGEKFKTFDVSDSEYVMLPLGMLTATTTLQINYTNGESPIYLADEFRALACQSNEVLFSVGGLVVTGFADYAVFKVSDVESIEVRRDSTTAYDLFFIDSDYRPNMESAVRKNERRFNISALKKGQRLLNRVPNLAENIKQRLINFSARRK